MRRRLKPSRRAECVAMVDPDLLNLLCCPETHQDVVLADPSLVEKLNAQISTKSLKNRAGRVVKRKLDAGLIRADRKFLYPSRDDIPVMLIDEAVPLSQIRASLG